MKLLVLGLISIAILIYLIYNECWKVHRCTPFPNMKRNSEDRIYGGSTVNERRSVIDMKEGMAAMPAFDEQAKMEKDYVDDKKLKYGQREDDPQGMLDVSKELTQFKKLSKAGWEGRDAVDLSGNLRKLETSQLKVAKESDMGNACLLYTSPSPRD